MYILPKPFGKVRSLNSRIYKNTDTPTNAPITKLHACFDSFHRIDFYLVYKHTPVDARSNP